MIDLGGGEFDYRETRVEFDELGRAVKTTFDDGTVSETRYNHLGQRDAEIAPYDPANPPADLATITTSYGYDPAAGRLELVTLPTVTDGSTGSTIGTSTYQYGYDNFGNQTSITDPNDHVTEFTFDYQNRQTSRTLPIGVDSALDDTDFVERSFFDDTAINPQAAGADESVGNGQLAYSVDFEGSVTEYRPMSLLRLA